MAASVLNTEKLEKLLRRAKVTQQSIQQVSNWILEKRAHLAEIVEVWARLMRENETAQQVVYLYIANDTMQIGVRKYGHHIAEFFEAKLPEIVEMVMTESEEKAKRCLIKIVGIWKERHTINADLLAGLERVCAGKPFMDESSALTSGKAPANSLEEQVQAAMEAFQKTVLTEESKDRTLEDMPDVAESDETRAMNERLQDLVSATISADLLSDRLFQLESGLSTFHHAVEAFSDAETSAQPKDTEEMPESTTSSSGGGIVWEMMDQQVYDLDIDRSREHVQQFRDNIEQQNAKRDELLAHMDTLLDFDPFVEPIFHSSHIALHQQATGVEHLLELCLRAEHRQQQQQQEQQRQQAQARAYSNVSSSLRTSTSASPRDRPPRNEMPDVMFQAPSYSPRDRFPDRASPSNVAYDQKPPFVRRYSSNYEMYSTATKRTKLTHSHSYDERESPTARSPRWQQDFMPPPNAYGGDARYANNNMRFSPRDMGPPRPYEEPRYAPSPRQSSPRVSRWDTRPDDNQREYGRW